MLISSHRHTKDDLVYWKWLAESDMLRRSDVGFLKQHTAAMNAILSFVIRDRCYCSVSWGKDSVVVAHLLWCIRRDIPLVYIRPHPNYNPDCVAVRDAFLSRFPMPYIERNPDYTQDDSSFDREWKLVERDLGTSRRMTGIRAAESGGRRIRMRTWGVESPNTLAPIGWWSTADVFTYLATHDLPIHPAYAMLGGGRWDREQLRVDEIGVVDSSGQFRERRGERGGMFGAGEWEREYYGDVLRRLEAKKAVIASGVVVD